MKSDVLKTIICVFAFAASAAGQKLISNDLFTATNVKYQMIKVADWQLGYWKTNGFKESEYSWINATAYAGHNNFN